MVQRGGFCMCVFSFFGFCVVLIVFVFANNVIYLRDIRKFVSFWRRMAARKRTEESCMCWLFWLYVFYVFHGCGFSLLILLLNDKVGKFIRLSGLRSLICKDTKAICRCCGRIIVRANFCTITISWAEYNSWFVRKWCIKG